jgi:hypothetical protein
MAVMAEQDKKEYRHFGHHVPEEARLHAKQAHEELGNHPLK